MVLLASPEHDRDLDLRALVEKALDVALLGVVVVNSDLRSELDLLEKNGDLMLAGELRLLLLLVAVLAVIHDARDRRIRLRCDLDEIEILRLGVFESFLRVLDPDLTAVLIHEANLRRTNS